jgi:hypothetical protein
MRPFWWVPYREDYLNPDKKAAEAFTFDLTRGLFFRCGFLTSHLSPSLQKLNAHL